MALRELASLEKYLGLKKPNKYSTQGDKKVPVLQNNNAPPLVGLVTIACHLVKEAKRPELLGDGAEGRAVVQQWLEYRVTKLDSHTEDTKSILKATAEKRTKRPPEFEKAPLDSRSFYRGANKWLVLLGHLRSVSSHDERRRRPSGPQPLHARQSLPGREPVDLS
ncbi:PREDICTED: eukaryotic translation elongation factor 1 epsilon-1 isoform X2 [Poecilia mexicana]|uniref:eukaryotic translation elongation factor 1 epsilon-1 isoform X2 n=1 Tax=Poecilia mexicana TaxID=48701 RepID=UPI00072E49E4|nr:PREDICTED: eukaryotic translation elongation factor 1 epsilon-1 isoform X2 [Poecilia mexicana]